MHAGFSPRIFKPLLLQGVLKKANISIIGMFNLIQLVLKLLVLLLHLLDIIVRLRSPILSTHLPLPIVLFLLSTVVLSHLDFILGKTLEHEVFTASATVL